MQCRRDLPEGQKRLVALGAGIAVLADLFLGPLARQGLLHTLFLARLQVIRVALYFLDNVFRLDFTFKPAQRVFQRLAFLNRTSAKLFLRAKVS